MKEYSREELEAMEAQLPETTEPAQRVDLLSMLAYGFRLHNIDRAREYAGESRLLALELNDKARLAESLVTLGSTEELKFNFAHSLKYLFEAQDLFTELQNVEKVIQCNSSIGKCYIQMGDYLNALEYFYKNISLAEKLEDDPMKLVRGLINAGIMHARIEEFEKALELYNRALAISRKIGSDTGLAFALVNMGSSLTMLGQPEKALECYHESAELLKKTSDRLNYSNVLGNLGITYSKLGDYARAEKYLLESYALKEAAGDHFNQLTNHISLSMLYRQSGRPEAAEEHVGKALAIAENSESLYLRKQAYEAAHALYEEIGRHEKALDYYKLFHGAEKEIFGKEKSHQMKNIQVKYEVDSIQHEKEIYRLKNIDLANANEQISLQKELIEQKNKDITDSINYARRIQRVLLAHHSTLRKHLRDYFVLYRPKDIVSGDFYWAAATGDRFLLAACDCTGHGVPGAFMSLLNISFLNEAVGEKDITRPDLVLNYVRERIIRSLTDETDSEGGKDGMDAVLCSFDLHSRTLQFTGANNSLWIVRRGELLEFPPDKMPVGRWEVEQKPFSLREVAVEEGDMIYLFTDGYADQFGGPKGKKFKYSQLKEKLLALHALPAAEQQARLEKIFDDWKGNIEQIDDVLIIGVRV